mmetsp:Transcript_103355/g.331415  ORF Transcript_103355/g.331415 Transcript_103355/m.331415 type:complete len:271 (-) Transcript_103355:326-1138(-)
MVVLLQDVARLRTGQTVGPGRRSCRDRRVLGATEEDHRLPKQGALCDLVHLLAIAGDLEEAFLDHEEVRSIPVALAGDRRARGDVEDGHGVHDEPAGVFVDVRENVEVAEGALDEAAVLRAVDLPEPLKVDLQGRWVEGAAARRVHDQDLGEVLFALPPAQGRGQPDALWPPRRRGQVAAICGPSALAILLARHRPEEGRRDAATRGPAAEAGLVVLAHGLGIRLADSICEPHAGAPGTPRNRKIGVLFLLLVADASKGLHKGRWDPLVD